MNKQTSEKIPSHVAIIMDGNGRWAKQRLKNRLFGHQNAIQAVREAIEFATENGIQYLTLYTFSEENWQRPKAEVDGLMELLAESLKNETPRLIKNGVRLQSIGNRAALPKSICAKLQTCFDDTAAGTNMTLTIALSYGGRQEIIEAVKRYAQEVLVGTQDVARLTPALFERYLFTSPLPAPDLLIRTGGEQRISNFMLWQMAYTELYFTDLLWPDFRKSHFLEALKEYGRRERRYGKTSEQLQ